MRLKTFIKNEVKNGIVLLTSGDYDYLFIYNSREKIWNCSIYDSKEAEIANFYDKELEPVKEITYKNDSEVLEAIKNL